MPGLSNHQSAVTTKMLLIGDSGAGKTGALASLAQAGYNLRIIDMDNGLDVLSNLLNHPQSPYGPEAISRVVYETVTDPMRNVNGKLIPRAATAWQRAVKLLDSWESESTKLGPVSAWTPQDILVIDSLTLLSNSAMNFCLSMNARLGQQPHQSDWYQAQQLLESMIQMLYDDGVKCNVIINCHVTYIGEENGPQRGYPMTLGKALSPKIGRYFNTVLMARSSGTGANAKRKILTNSVPMVELKNTAPLRVKPEYDLATGLAEYFRDVRGQGAKP
jgi:hypothetical protein